MGFGFLDSSGAGVCGYFWVDLLLVLVVGLGVVIAWFCVARFLWCWCSWFGFGCLDYLVGLGAWFGFVGLRLVYVCNFGLTVGFGLVCCMWFVRVVILSLGFVSGVAVVGLCLWFACFLV